MAKTLKRADDILIATGVAIAAKLRCEYVINLHSTSPTDSVRKMTEFVRISWGGSNSLATAVPGAFPVVFGLSFEQAIAATVLGVCVGSLILAKKPIFGRLSGTNNTVSSSAQFGVVGRTAGSYLSLLTAIFCFSISMCSSGDAVMGALRRLLGGLSWELGFAPARAVFGPKGPRCVPARTMQIAPVVSRSSSARRGVA